MNKQQYGMTQVMLVQIASELHALDLDGFIEWIDRADTLGPILDPTLYIKHQRAGNPMAAMRAIAAAARQMRAAMPDSCRECGCSNGRACLGGCSWIAPGLCTNCAPAAVEVLT